jgi:hypothetical protein
MSTRTDPASAHVSIRTELPLSTQRCWGFQGLCVICLLHSRGLLLMGVSCRLLCAETMTGMTGAPAGTATTTATTATPPGMTGTDTLTRMIGVTGAMPPSASMLSPCPPWFPQNGTSFPSAAMCLQLQVGPEV